MLVTARIGTNCLPGSLLMPTLLMSSDLPLLIASCVEPGAAHRRVFSRGGKNGRKEKKGIEGYELYG